MQYMVKENTNETKKSSVEIGLPLGEFLGYSKHSLVWRATTFTSSSSVPLEIDCIHMGCVFSSIAS